MAEVVLFHYVPGLTAGVIAFADDPAPCRSYRAHTGPFRRSHHPDRGRRHGTHRRIGFDEVVDWGTQAVEGLAGGLVYAGSSLGVVPAQKLAQTRPGAVGALFFCACVPVSYFGAWPDGVPVQIHGMNADPIFVDRGDVEAARALVTDVADAELFLYPGDRHNFADSSSSSYDEAAASLPTERVLEFLATKM